MIVCVCKAVNDRAIRRAVAEGHDTFDAVQFELGVGSQCGKCVESVCEVLFDARVEGFRPHACPSVASIGPAPAAHPGPLRFVERPSTRETALA